MMIGVILLVFFVQSILQFSLLFVLGLSRVTGGDLVEMLRQIFSPTTGGDGDLAELWRQMFMPQLTTWEELIAYSIRHFVSVSPSLA